MTNTLQTATSSKNKRIVFFGNERLVSGLKHTTAPILNGLIERGYTVVGVVSHYNYSQSRNQRELEVANIAAKHNIPLFLPNNPSEILNELRELKANIAVLVAYGRIIHQEVMDVFPQGIVNIHPSLLPRYRGSTPIESAILHGDTETGVSVMQLSPGMDEGPVYAQQPVILKGTETKFELYQQLQVISEQLFFDIFPSILDNSLQPQPQDPTQATYSQLFNKQDGILDPATTSALEAERKVRAHLGFPKTKISLFGQSIIITKAHISHQKKTPLDIECRGGAFLSIDELIGPSGKSMDAQAFLNGYAAGA